VCSQRDDERRRHKDIVDEMTSSFSALQSRVATYHARLRAAMAQAQTTL
jgi:hypothetical protein